MANYKCTWMNEALQNEVDELMKGEHGRAITLYGLECATAGIKGYKEGQMKTVALGLLLGIAAAGCESLIRHTVKKRNEKKQDEPKQNDVS